jgi:hypothetical protein
MSIKQTIWAIHALGLTCIRTHYGEYRVNFPAPQGTEGTAFYTEDADDALATARVMSANSSCLWEDSHA